MTPISTGMGPRPAATPGAPGATPSATPAGRTILATLRAQPAPVTLATLVTTTGLHTNTVREHLTALTDAGVVTRGRTAPQGRGRPAATYAALSNSATSEPDVGPVSAEYSGLAAALASTIHRTSNAPGRDAASAGTEWGHELARTRPGPHPADDVDPRGRVVHLLADLGFAPRPVDDTRAVLLTRCPLLETARMYPDVVCAVHLGLVRGALGEYGADPEGAELHPFSDPGACRLDLARPDGVSR